MEHTAILDKITRQLIRHEKLELTSYLDTKGILTVGIGHNCKANPVRGIDRPGIKITEQFAFELLASDLRKIEASMLSYSPWMRELDDARYGVMLNMAFNLGAAGLAGFKTTLRFVEAGGYRQAAIRMLKTLWAKQVGDFPPDSPKARRIGRPGRAWELAEQMCTGKWQGI